MKENAGSFPNRDFIERGQDNDNSYLLERLRYHLGYLPNPWLLAYVEGQDSFEQGDKRVPSPEADYLSLRQACVSLGDPRQSPLVAKVGRQELAYGDERVLGVSDWSTVGRTMDAAKLRLVPDEFWVDAFAACQC